VAAGLEGPVITDVRTLDLGGLALPLDVVTRTALVVGQKGTGKTSTAVVMAEEASAAGARFAVIDPTGAWHGIRSSADGDGPGLDCVVMGGFHGDVPLDPGAGEIVARLIVEDGYSVVCDLERMHLENQALFVADFTEAIYHLCRSAVTVLIDEARRFVPQAAGKRGDSTVDDLVKRCRTAIVDIVQLGRRKGLGSVLIGQRLTNIAADAREQADLLIIHRLLGANDRKMIATWLEDAGADAAAILEQIPTLKVGQAAVLAPEVGVLGVFDIRAKRTFDSSATPDVGAVILDAPSGRAEIDLGALEEKMGSALEAAREDDPESLRARIRQLEIALSRDGAADEVETQAERDLQARLDAALRRIDSLEGLAVAAARGIEEINDVVNSEAQVALYGRLVTGAGRLIHPELAPGTDFTQDDGAARRAPTGMEGVQSLAAPAESTATRRQTAEQEPNGGQHTPSTFPAGGGGSKAGPAGASETAGSSSSDAPPLKAGARRMLDVLARYGPLARRELAILSKVSPVSGTVSDYLSVMRQSALVGESDGKVHLTNAGYAQIGLKPADTSPPTFTPEQVYALWSGDLKAGARRMMEHLMRAHPEGYTRRELAGLAGISPQSGTVSDYMSTLRRRGLVEERNRRVYAGRVLYLGTEGA
jgi:hypothetical protein